MPCKQCDNGKWQWGNGPCQYDTKEACERAHAGDPHAEDDFILMPNFSVQVPNLFDHFGIWMIEPESFRNAVQRVQGINLHAHIQSQQAADVVKQQSAVTYESTDDGIAILRVNGPMMKQVSSLAEGTSTVRLRQQLRAARRSADIGGALLYMDTPGGTARGNSDLADEVRRFAQEKPIVGFVEDMTASAGVSVISQTTQIWANNSAAMYGAMGTYAVLEDMSGRADQLGVKVIVVKAGEFKGMGEPGTQITEEQINEIQRIVDRLNENYLLLIAAGRNRPVESVRPLADGRVIFADDAKAAGLIDQIGTYGQALNAVRDLVGTRKPQPAQVLTPVAKETKKMEPATLAELKAAFPNAGSDWILSQLEAGATMLDASKAYAQHVESKAAEAEERHKKELEEAQAAKSSAPSAGTGWQPLTVESSSDAGETGDPIEDFDSAVIAHMERYRCERLQAVDAVRRRNPKLAQAYLLATNNTQYAKRSLNERFDALGVTAVS